MKKIIFLVSCVTFVGCAHMTRDQELNQKLDMKLANETSIHSRPDLVKESTDLIDKSKDLTDAQRTQLASLREKTTERLNQIQVQSLKLRAVLIQDVVAEPYNSDEVELIKKQLTILGTERISTMMDSARQTNLILGRWGSRAERLDADYFEQILMWEDPSTVH